MAISLEVYVVSNSPVTHVRCAMHVCYGAHGGPRSHPSQLTAMMNTTCRGQRPAWQTKAVHHGAGAKSKGQHRLESSEWRSGHQVHDAAALKPNPRLGRAVADTSAALASSLQPVSRVHSMDAVHANSFSLSPYSLSPPLCVELLLFGPFSHTSCQVIKMNFVDLFLYDFCVGRFRWERDHVRISLPEPLSLTRVHQVGWRLRRAFGWRLVPVVPRHFARIPRSLFPVALGGSSHLSPHAQPFVPVVSFASPTMLSPHAQPFLPAVSHGRSIQLSPHAQPFIPSTILTSSAQLSPHAQSFVPASSSHSLSFLSHCTPPCVSAAIFDRSRSSHSLSPHLPPFMPGASLARSRQLSALAAPFVPASPAPSVPASPAPSVPASGSSSLMPVGSLPPVPPPLST